MLPVTCQRRLFSSIVAEKRFIFAPYEAVEWPDERANNSWQSTQLPSALLDRLAKAFPSVYGAGPTQIQQLSMPLILQDCDVMMHAPTGSGKTLAFLLPTLCRISDALPASLMSVFAATKRQIEQSSKAKLKPNETAKKRNSASAKESRSSSLNSLNSPSSASSLNRGWRAMIVVPTRELALQVRAELETLIDGDVDVARVCNTVIGGPVSAADQLDALRKRRAPMVIGTPNRLLEVLQLDATQRAEATVQRLVAKPLFEWRALRTVVVDEIDQVVPPVTRFMPSAAAGRLYRHPPAGAVLLHYVLGGQQLEQRSGPATPSKYATCPMRSTLLKPPHLQTVLASATLGRQTRNAASRQWIRRLAWRTKVGVPIEREEQLQMGCYVKAQGAFRVPDAVDHRYMTVDHPTERFDRVADIVNIWRMTGRAARLRRVALLFVADEADVRQYVDKFNSADGNITASLLSDSFRRKPDDDDTDNTHRFVQASQQRRRHLLEQLEASDGDGDDDDEPSGDPLAESEKPFHIIVAHARAIRGIHIDKVPLVIIDSSPRSDGEYLHMAGRCGRADQPGTCVTLFLYHQQSHRNRLKSHIDIDLLPFDDL
jgi:superfamily II DNA/RNA helicase